MYGHSTGGDKISNVGIVMLLLDLLRRSGYILIFELQTRLIICLPAIDHVLKSKVAIFSSYDEVRLGYTLYYICVYTRKH
jgi:hypothetical protein